MEEYPKTACLYHPQENITNFCREKNCLMPLCPTCICSHVDIHLNQKKSSPKFQNINQAFNIMSSQIKSINERFTQSSYQLEQIDKIVIVYKKTLSDLIFATKIQVRDMVQKGFEQLQKQLEDLVQRENQKRGLHVQEGLDLLRKGIVDISNKLTQMKDDLKTDKGLSSLITFNHQTKWNIEKYQEVIAKQIKNNQDYYPIPNVNSGIAAAIKQNLAQLISIKFNLPTQFSKSTPTIKTEESEVGTPIRGPMKSPKLNLSINSSLEKFHSIKTPGTKTPLARTCLNSLRSSFGQISKPNITSNKSPTINPTSYMKKVSSPLAGTISPKNINKLLETKVADSLQGVYKSKPVLFKKENVF